MTEGQPKIIGTRISAIGSSPRRMPLKDRAYVGGVLIHVADMDQEDVADGQARLLFGAWPGDEAGMVPRFRRHVPQQFRQAGSAGAEQSQGRRERAFVVSPTPRPFLLRQAKVPGNGEFDAVSPDDSPQEYLPHQLAFDSVMHVLPDGPTLADGQIEVGLAQPGDGCFQPFGELKVFLQERFMGIGHGLFWPFCNFFLCADNQFVPQLQRV